MKYIIERYKSFNFTREKAEELEKILSDSHLDLDFKFKEIPTFSFVATDGKMINYESTGRVADVLKAAGYKLAIAYDTTTAYLYIY